VSEAIYDFPSTSPQPTNTGRKLVQMWISADLATVIDSFRNREPDAPSRNEAIRRLIHLGLADDALYRRKRREKK
jgi:hypothetical protein